MTPDELGISSEIIQQAAINVSRKLFGQSVGVDLDLAEKHFRAMVSEVRLLDMVAQELSNSITDGEGR